MDNQETPINDSEPRRSRRSRAAERVSLWFEEWILWRGGDALRASFDLARRPFEWLAWVVRRGLLWPLQDRTANLGGPGRALAALAGVLVVAVAVAAVLGGSEDGGDGEPVSQQVAAAPEAPVVVAPKGPEEKAQPTLQGASPVFEPAKRKQKSSATETAQPGERSPTGTDPATATIGSEPGGGASASSSSASSASSPQSEIGVDARPAGARAIAVAEDFATAFVLFETGGEESKVRRVFAATATPELSKSLLRRPPRLPANVEVPKARVVNVVAGPSQGGVYTVSVSLLRIGLTSELRLDMEKLKDDGWRVTNVLG